jgi:hypothetical protein
MKWFVAAGAVAFVGIAVWQFLDEAARSARRPKRPRQPWDI